MLATEDSAHYMLYTFFFYNQVPTSIYLLPPLLYAIVFTHKYTDGMKQVSSKVMFGLIVSTPPFPSPLPVQLKYLPSTLQRYVLLYGV
jgi:hypothetical protein